MKTHLVFAIATLALLALVISQSRRKTLTFETIIDIARITASQPYRPRDRIASKALQQLNYDQVRDIRWRDEYTLWREQGLPFQAKFFFTAGEHQSLPVTIFQVNRDGAGPLRFSPDFFDFGKNSLAAKDQAAGAFAGFRFHYPLNKADYLDEVFVYLGSNYFRAVAKEQQYGLSARGIAIDTEGKEEFPAFTTFWLVQPKPSDQHLTLYSLLEGKSVAGAYEFVVEPGVETRMHVRAALFFRKRVKQLGLAPLTSMFWFGENTSNTFGDFRPEVHDSDGLLIQNGNGEWIWRPLAWSRLQQINAFADENPKGFGLLQRDRDFGHYQDLEAKYHQRPSLWVVPHGAWGEGAVKLIQLPTNNEAMDNVVAFWQPAESPGAGGRIDVAYTLIWYTSSGDRPPIGRCVSTRIEYKEQAYFRKYVLDFWGPELSNLPETAPVQADVTVSEGGSISEVQVQKNPNDNTWRVTFTVSWSQEDKFLDVRCPLLLNGKPLGETWAYTIMPQ